ncbi:hypothetical protein PVK06_028296 [Gossypium arboreum]|uniref:Uncharacterized protein n=1 Tax=Gossypium arboreum TaxID=29729 RepID=A0ABR0P2V0_GOSAR|nr:hypothetical protein PVK06_028296 [Gossypium arboreum]
MERLASVICKRLLICILCSLPHSSSPINFSSFIQGGYSYSSFFSYLTGIINLVASLIKRDDQLRDIEASYIAELIGGGELETGKGKNQVDSLQFPSNTRWGSHLASLNSLMRMLDSICVVLQDIIKSRNLTRRSEADGIYDAMISVEFAFILHFMIEMLGITNDLYQTLQYKSQGILNATQLMSSTKMLL